MKDAPNNSRGVVVIEDARILNGERLAAQLAYERRLA